MTKLMHKVQLDRWLICSDGAFRSLSDFWRSETGPSSLLGWRLTSQTIEQVPFKMLKSRLETLAAEASWNIVVVVDKAETTLLEILEICAENSDIHLVEWHQSPLAAVLGMNAPDRALLDVLRHAEDGEAAGLELVSPISDRTGYATALLAWEKECRDNDSHTFAEMLPAFAVAHIPWPQFLGTEGITDAVPTAANDNWIELVRLAASTPIDEAKAISLEDPRNKPAQWTLTLSPIDGGPATLAIFSVNPEAIAAFEGCIIKLRIRGDIIELGAIDDEGQAEAILNSPVEMQGLAISWDDGE
jgi:hypothetical protein